MLPRLKVAADRLARSPMQLALLLGVGAWLLFVFRLGVPTKNFFDEVHYVPAARTLLTLDIPRNTEHPLVAKELIAAGIAIFGDNPWGWRLIPSLFGAATITGMFAFLWLLFRNTRTAVLGSLLLVLNQMVFIQARIAMLDVFLGAFILWAMVVFVWAARGTPKQVLKRWVLGSVLLGLAVGVKWAAIPYVAMAGIAFIVLRLTEQKGSRKYASVGLTLWVLCSLVLLYLTWKVVSAQLGIAQSPPFWASGPIGLLTMIGIVAAAVFCWKKLRVAIAAFAKPTVTPSPNQGHRRWPGLGLIPGLLLMGVVSIATYLITFAPAFFYQVNPITFSTMIDYQLDMYAQQTQILAAHTYQSEWYQWPLISRPMWYFYEEDAGAWRGVLLVGNPLIMWAGVLAVILCAISWLETKALRSGVIAMMWIASVAIYIVIPKSLGFYYYYYLSSFFICMALPVAFDALDPQRRIGLGEWFTAASFLLFLYFYPIIAAMPLEGGQSFLNWMWFPSWL